MLVDQNYLNSIFITKYLEHSLKKFHKKFDAVILGCTHYSLLKDDIGKILCAKTFDGNSAIGTYVKKKMEKHGAQKGKTKLISTIKSKQKYLSDCYKKIKGEKICAE